DPAEVDGCLIIDKRAVLEEKPGLAYRSPMCNATLGDNGISRFRHNPEVADSLVLQAFAQGNSTHQMLASLAAVSIHSQDDEPAPLDFVGPALYAAWWRQRGASIGVLRCEPTPHIERAEESAS